MGSKSVLWVFKVLGLSIEISSGRFLRSAQYLDRE